MTDENSKAHQRGTVLDVLVEHAILSDEGDLDAWAVERIRAAVVASSTGSGVSEVSEVADQLDSEALGMAGDLHGVAEALIARVLPASGTRYDGDPIFEALVFGWTCSDTVWNGEKAKHATADRSRLAGFYQQYLEQRPEFAVGDRVMLSTAVGWRHGEVVGHDGEGDDTAVRVRWDENPDVTGRVRLASEHYRLIAEPHLGGAR